MFESKVPEGSKAFRTARSQQLVYKRPQTWWFFSFFLFSVTNQTLIFFKTLASLRHYCRVWIYWIVQRTLGKKKKKISPFLFLLIEAYAWLLCGSSSSFSRRVLFLPQNRSVMSQSPCFLFQVLTKGAAFGSITSRRITTTTQTPRSTSYVSRSNRFAY